MTLWLDAHISPKLASWIHDTFGIDVIHVRDLSLREAEDPDIFFKAREADAIVITKDRDFVELLGRLGPPPKIIWCTCGNTSNTRLRTILLQTLSDALDLLNQGDSLVEISDAERVEALP